MVVSAAAFRAAVLPFCALLLASACSSAPAVPSAPPAMAAQTPSVETVSPKAPPAAAATVAAKDAPAAPAAAGAASSSGASAASEESPAPAPEQRAKELLQAGRPVEAAEVLASAGGQENLRAAGDLFLGSVLPEKAAAAYRMAGVADPGNRIGDSLFGRGDYAASAEWYAKAGNRDGILKAADALFEKGSFKAASACYEMAGMKDGKAAKARLVVDCEALFFAFHFSDAFLARLGAGTIDLGSRPSEADAGREPEFRELILFHRYITRDGAPRLAPADLLSAREYFRGEAGRLFTPADRHAPTTLEILRANYLVSQAAMANVAARILSGWR